MNGIVLIPAYNEADSIEAVIVGLRHHAPDFDRLVISDGSKDATPQIAAALGERVLSLPCNVGYGRALQAGLRYALRRRYDLIVFVDGDGQHRPQDVPRLAEALNQLGADVVIGSRFDRERPYVGPLGRRIGQAMLSRFTRLLLGRRVYDTTSGFKAITADAAKALVQATFLDFHIEALVRLGLSGFEIEETPVSMNERRSGESMYNLLSAVEYPLKTFVLTIAAALDALLQRRAKG